MRRERYELSGNELFYWKEQDGHLYRQHVSLDEAMLLKQNAEVRANGGARTLSFGRMVLRMTEVHYHLLCKKYPGLLHGDAREKDRIWEKVSRDPDFAGLVVGKW